MAQFDTPGYVLSGGGRFWVPQKFVGGCELVFLLLNQKSHILCDTILGFFSKAIRAASTK
ncbi:hypothetical protein K3N28_06035 [Glycomyces sp. TRM65418]|uniref:hypothetical protein n=1 Tax=Glycomyces sp. TRM65418 TaxID=2867006 RepID=UPI001CE58D5E|nr:hypothetical protein [Glycomyces sp. TRM65418]MCC3762629.1 hypothetical protein [Glycomyces sp. TRM65418]QZD56667.1 hypothetical protein K3N28_05995 [Glycomyces sp. TRM65418]